MKFPCSLSLALFVSTSLAVAETIEADIVIFGGTSGGIAAAVQAQRMGRSVAIAEWTNHLGGLTTGGLGATGIGNKGAIGGIAREFYEQIHTHYADEKNWKWQKPVPGVEQSKGKDPVVAKTGRETKGTFEPQVAMQKIDYAALKTRLLADGQILEWTGPKREMSAPRPKLGGLVLNDEDAEKKGEWPHGSSGSSARIGEGYLHDGDDHKGECSVTWKPEIKEAGEYEIVPHFPPNANRAKNVPVLIFQGRTKRVATVNQQEKSGSASLGRHTLAPGGGLAIILSSQGTDGHVVADGVQLKKVGK